MVKGGVVAEAGHPKLHGWEGQAFINTGCPSSMAGATCPEEGPWATGWVDPVEVMGATPQTLHNGGVAPDT